MSSRAEGVHRRIHHPLRAAEVGDVLAVRSSLAAERLDLAHDVVGWALVGALAGERRAEVVDEHLRARPRKCERVLAADPAPGARDDRDLALEVRHRSSYVNAFSPVSARPMMSFWIWLVPSYSVVTRASRRYFPTGYSSM